MSIIEYPHYSGYGEEIGPVIQWLVDHDETEAADNIRKLFAREIAAQSALAAIREVRDGYASQARFADIDAASYFREFIRRLDVAAGSPKPNPSWAGTLADANNNPTPNQTERAGE